MNKTLPKTDNQSDILKMSVKFLSNNNVSLGDLGQCLNFK